MPMARLTLAMPREGVDVNCSYEQIRLRQVRYGLGRTWSKVQQGAQSEGVEPIERCNR